jgi:hypothetical protein
MPLIALNDNPSDRELRQFAAIWFPLACIIVAGVAYYRAGWEPVTPFALAVGLTVGVIGCARVGFIRPLYLGWLYAAYPLGWLVSHAVLGIVFFLVMTPLGWVMRFSGYDPLRRRVDPTAATFWTVVETDAHKTGYLRQF